MKLEFSMDGEMEQYAPEIKRFLGLMLEKLHKNVHKGKWEDLDVRTAFQLMLTEIRELRQSLDGGFPSDDIIRECADVANFAMILASIAEKPQ
jgi:hypothetical protein